MWPGQDWRAVIRQAITGGTLVFLACFSTRSTARQTGFQNAELALAAEQARLRRAGDSWLIPVRFDDCALPDLDLGGGRRLDGIQRADLFGVQAEAAAERLVEAIARILRTAPRTNPVSGLGYARTDLVNGEPERAPDRAVSIAPHPVSLAGGDDPPQGSSVGTPRRGEITWDDSEVPSIVIKADQMPTESRANPLRDAVAMVTVSVPDDLPFSRIAVSPGERWRGDTTDGMDVQIGVDAKGEPQRFVMGTAGVHLGLVGGDVGMGKTNLLHVLINQLALRYPPEELELFLLDFKGVEFDAYMTEHLPHLRAIVSRTDREFGLSVLRRFHDEIDRRARLFLEAKATNLPDYRRQTGRVLPRALMIMDEPHLIFEEEDRLSREAGHLLANIARRGRAFGLHLLLAIPSPGGSPAVYLRPVYEQMALRIALPCKVSYVSQAILGEGNDAATRLTRAGDAIYNDRRSEGANSVTRIALLPTNERRKWITTIRSLGGDREYLPPATFDPDAPADFTAHPACAAFAARPGQWPEPGSTVEAWLGEAIEIKPATAATFERYLRSNLLIVGGEEHGYGLLLATLLSVAVQRSPTDVSFTITEFARPSSLFRGFLASAGRLPHSVRVAGPQEASAAMEELLAELDARLADGTSARFPDWFFLIAGIRSWQGLLTEDRYGRPGGAARQLIRLAEMGPDVGIHVVAWADSYGAAERALRRHGISHFGLRAVLRVGSAVESDSLLGIPGAASLDDDRAFYRDADWPVEHAEKFKPYSNTSLQDFARTAFGGLA